MNYKTTKRKIQTLQTQQDDLKRQIKKQNTDNAQIRLNTGKISSYAVLYDSSLKFVVELE